MAALKHWNVDIYIDEHADTTRAEARLTSADNKIEAVGTARRNPKDPNIPEIGDELATARALASLAHRLVDAAAADIEAVTGQPAKLSPEPPEPV